MQEIVKSRNPVFALEMIQTLNNMSAGDYTASYRRNPVFALEMIQTWKVSRPGFLVRMSQSSIRPGDDSDFKPALAGMAGK